MSVARTIFRLIDTLHFPFLRRLLSPTIFRYAACGGITLSVNAVCYALIYNFIIAKHNIDLGFVTVSAPIASLALVFPITFFTGFWLNRHVAFQTPSARTGKQLFRYALSVGGSILLTYACMKLLVEVCGLWPTPSNVVTSLLVALYSYFAARYFTFR